MTVIHILRILRFLLLFAFREISLPSTIKLTVGSNLPMVISFRPAAFPPRPPGARAGRHFRAAWEILITDFFGISSEDHLVFQTFFLKLFPPRVAFHRESPSDVMPVSARMRRVKGHLGNVPVLTANLLLMKLSSFEYARNIRFLYSFLNGRQQLFLTGLTFIKPSVCDDDGFGGPVNAVQRM